MQIPAYAARMAGLTAAAAPRWRAFIPRQINDAAAINQLGVRLEAYAQIQIPVILLGDGRSPAHLGNGQLC